MMDRSQLEFTMTYISFCQTLKEAWAKSTDVDKHYNIANGLYKRFTHSEHNREDISQLECMNRFFDDRDSFKIGYEAMEDLSPNDIVISLDGFHHKVAGCAKVPRDLRTDDAFWVVIFERPKKVFESEIFSKEGVHKKATELFSPLTLVSMFDQKEEPNP